MLNRRGAGVFRIASTWALRVLARVGPRGGPPVNKPCYISDRESTGLGFGFAPIATVLGQWTGPLGGRHADASEMR